jgi:hypothetical protein
MRFLLLLFPLVSMNPALAGGEECAASPGVLVFHDGSRMAVERCSVKGQLVVITTSDGKLHSIPREWVDLEATGRVNNNRRSRGDDTMEGLRADEGLEANPAAEVSSPGSGVASKDTAPRTKPYLKVVGGDEEPALDPAPAPLRIAGPAPPKPPEVMTRDESGRVTLRAVRITEPLQVDGKLEESVYRSVPSISGFIQQEPREGEPATEETEVWVLFDNENVYISARCWDSHPERIVANEMRRDNHSLDNNANFAVILDTFYDHRNGFLFHTNPLGGLFDGQVTDESNTNSDWNTVWEVKTGRFPQGWTVEFAIPFKSIRYKSGGSQIWGINFRRSIQWKNEDSFLTPIAAAYRRQGILKLSQAGTLVGIEPPPQSMNLEVKPYAITGSHTDLEATEPYTNDFDMDAGFDVKYGVTKSLTADFTYNTDFAQVENDEQQVNLTRFGLFFPEKREFFLEGQGLFNFAGRNTRRMGGGGQSDTPILFFSRRIGIFDVENEDGDDETHQVPINAGGRLTGRAGSYTIGALAMQTEELLEYGVPVTNFGVARLKRDIFGRSNIGLIGTHRSAAIDTPGSNTVIGADANFTFLQNLDINAYWARSKTEGLEGNDSSYMGSLRYGGDRYGVELEHLVIQENFNPEVGFIRREDIRKSRAQLRFSPRPRSIAAVRRFSFQGNINYYENNARVLETRMAQFEFRTEFQNSDSFEVQYSNYYEFLDEDFEIEDEIVIPIGGYNFHEMRYMYRFGPQRRMSGMVNFQHGSFYGGTRQEFSLWGRVEVTRQFSAEPRLSLNWVDLPQGAFTTNLVRVRTDYMFTPRMFLGALLQYNSAADTFSSNIRFRWEYQPGSDIYLVYSDGRDTTYGGFPQLETRSVVFKFTRLFRF